MAERFTQGASVTMDYLAGDHLSSTVALTNTGGGSQPYAIGEEDSWDAWGKRRAASGNDNSTCSLTSATLRGYTGQEMMDSFCLVNLNARMYDPWIGRFISADSMVPNPMSGQSFNRYSYVENNPLAFIDPSGHDGNAGGGDGPPCWYCVGTGLTNDVVGNPVPASNYGGGWNTYMSGWNGSWTVVSYSLAGLTLPPGTLTYADLGTTDTPTCNCSTSDAVAAGSSGIGSTGATNDSSGVSNAGTSGTDTVVVTGSKQVPVYLTIEGSAPNQINSNSMYFYYQVRDAAGLPVRGRMGFKEHSSPDQGTNSNNVYVPVDDGWVQDDVGFTNGTIQYDGTYIYNQTFTVQMGDDYYTLTTMLEHVIVVNNGIVISVNVFEIGR